MLIVRLLAAASVTDDRIVFASGTSPQNDPGATRGPIRFELVRRRGKWDKQNRTSLELCPGLTCQDLSRKRSSFLLKQKSNWKRITLLACSFYGCDSEYWPVIIDHPLGISVSLQGEHKQFMGNGNSSAHHLGERYFFCLTCNRTGRRIF